MASIYAGKVSSTFMFIKSPASVQMSQRDSMNCIVAISRCICHCTIAYLWSSGHYQEVFWCISIHVLCFYLPLKIDSCTYQKLDIKFQHCKNSCTGCIFICLMFVILGIKRALHTRMDGSKGACPSLQAASKYVLNDNPMKTCFNNK